MTHASLAGRTASRSWSGLGVKAIAQLCVAALVLGGLAILSMPKRAEAATEKVLILARSVVGGSSSIEANEAAAKGFAVDVVDDATWSSMTTAQFASYRAIILGDPDAALSSVAAAEANTATWGPAVTGNVVIIGTDPVGHASQGESSWSDAGSTSLSTSRARRGCSPP